MLNLFSVPNIDTAQTSWPLLMLKLRPASTQKLACNAPWKPGLSVPNIDTAQTSWPF